MLALLSLSMAPVQAAASKGAVLREQLGFGRWSPGKTIAYIPTSQPLLGQGPSAAMGCSWAVILSGKC